MLTIDHPDDPHIRTFHPLFMGPNHGSDYIFYHTFFLKGAHN